MAVFVLDKRKNPLMPCSEKRARLLLKKRRAVIHRVYPFTIRLKDRIGGELQPLRVKIDPGSKTTGVALVREKEERKEQVIQLIEITHKGDVIRKKMASRRALRRGRRGRNLRYRPARFDNRCRREGWLPPSSRHRIDTTLSWIQRLKKWAPLKALSMEKVRFDMQLMQNPQITSLEYQRGTLYGYEIREHLLEKWGRTCAYCQKGEIPLEIDHIHPRSRGGSDRIDNLVISCKECNQKKGACFVQEFLKKKPQILSSILATLKRPLKDAAAVNTTRNALYRELSDTGLPTETASGGKTKWNRQRFGIPKGHALDAACVGDVTLLSNWQQPVLAIRCQGRGSYQRTRVTKEGFPRGYLTREKNAFGFQTGDLVTARVLYGKKEGVYFGRVAIRATGNFNIQTSARVVQGIAHRHCKRVQRADGYAYTINKRSSASSPS
jgi:5-methylcytosine-specific restriction endonuclease McrA